MGIQMGVGIERDSHLQTYLEANPQDPTVISWPTEIAERFAYSDAHREDWFEGPSLEKESARV